MPNVISKIKQNSSDMNEIILAACDVISKIKQNSSDMNEIILAPCNAGYVQSCTGFFMVYDQNYHNCSTLVLADHLAEKSNQTKNGPKHTLHAVPMGLSPQF
jgi:hypothetical protein